MSQHKSRGEMPPEIHALAMASPQEQKLLKIQKLGVHEIWTREEWRMCIRMLRL